MQAEQQSRQSILRKASRLFSTFEPALPQAGPSTQPSDREPPMRSFFFRLFRSNAPGKTAAALIRPEKARNSPLSGRGSKSQPNLTTHVPVVSGSSSTTNPPLNQTPMEPISEVQKECNICRNELPPSEFPTTSPTPRCTHPPAACATCISRHIETGVTAKGALAVIICPTPKCMQRLQYEDIQRWATTQVFQRYDTLLLRQSLGQDGTFVWCKNSRCGHGQIHHERDTAPIVICSSCRSKSCFTHDLPWHDGLTCTQFDEAARRKKEQAENKPLDKASRTLRAEQDKQARTLIKVITKQCPGCAAPIEKNQGCDNMTCRCGRRFKWSLALQTAA